MKSRTLILTALSAIALLSCTRYTEEDATLVCGVPVKGTPWELASALASQREGGFVPECVEVYGDKAFIKGWIDTNAGKKLIVNYHTMMVYYRIKSRVTSRTGK